MPADRVVLIRHGESQWNAAGRWQGHGGPGLSPRGWRQAEAVAAHAAGAEPDVAAVVGSDLPRVVETATPTTGALGHDLRVDVRLREIDVGWWSGLTTPQVEARDPDAVAALRSGSDIPRGGGETAQQLRDRVVPALRELAAAYDGGTVLVFSHGGPIRAVVGHLLGLSVRQQGALSGPDNCSRTVVVSGDHGARLRCFNETAHLAGA